MSSDKQERSAETTSSDTFTYHKRSFGFSSVCNFIPVRYGFRHAPLFIPVLYESG